MKVHTIIFLFIAAGILLSGILVIGKSITNFQQNSNTFVEKTAVDKNFEALKQEYLAKGAKIPYKVPVSLLNKYPNNVDFCQAYCNTNCIVEKINGDDTHINVYC